MGKKCEFAGVVVYTLSWHFEIISTCLGIKYKKWQHAWRCYSSLKTNTNPMHWSQQQQLTTWTVARSVYKSLGTVILKVELTWILRKCALAAGTHPWNLLPLPLSGWVGSCNLKSEFWGLGVAPGVPHSQPTPASLRVPCVPCLLSVSPATVCSLWKICLFVCYYYYLLWRDFY